jgi:hypothetical protein
MLLIFAVFASNACTQEGARNKAAISAHLTVDNFVRGIVIHPAFSGFGERLPPRDDNSSYYNTRLSNAASLMPYYQNVNPAEVVNALNAMIDEAKGGEKIF